MNLDAYRTKKLDHTLKIEQIHEKLNKMDFDMKNQQCSKFTFNIEFGSLVAF